MAKKNLSLISPSKATNSWDLLEEVIARIREEPKRLAMSNWVSMLNGEVVGSFSGELDDEDDVAVMKRKLPQAENPPECGTVCCVSGWIGILRHANGMAGSPYKNFP